MANEFEREMELDRLRSYLVQDFDNIARSKFQGTHYVLYHEKMVTTFLAKWASRLFWVSVFGAWLIPVDSTFRTVMCGITLLLGVLWGFAEGAKGQAAKAYLQYFDQLDVELAPILRGIKVSAGGLHFAKLLYFALSQKLKKRNTYSLHLSMAEIERSIDVLNNKAEDENIGERKLGL